MTAAPQRILLIQLHHLGDVLLTTPAIRAARRAFPAAKIDYASNTLGASALAGNPHLDDILAQPRLRDIFRARYDVVVDMHSVPRSARIVAASRARTRIGLRGRGPRNLAYTQLLPRELEAVYMARQKLALLAPLGIDVDAADLSLEITLSEADRSFAARQFDALGLSAPVVALSPVARHAFKQWGTENWAHVADELARQGAQILVTHGPGEAEQARAVAAAMRHPPVVNHGATTIHELGALYERCTLWLGNDGGPKHVAAAVKTPTLAVFRRRLGAVWSDLRPGSGQYAIDAGSDNLQDVEPGRVAATATELLTRYAARGNE